MDTPDPHLIEKDANLVIFEEKDIQEKGQYSGRFTVEAVAGKQVQLKPCMRMTQREVQRLQASRDKWCMYEIMPIDNHTVFANCDELDKLIPQSSLDEYVKDGQPTDPNNPEAEKFQRKLRDYSVLFTAYHQAHSVWLQKMEAANRDKGYVEAGLAQAKREVEECQKDLADLKGELAQINRERMPWPLIARPWKPSWRSARPSRRPWPKIANWPARSPGSSWRLPGRSTPERKKWPKST